MNEDIILQMVEPYVKNSAITYGEFDKIFAILSRKEQYQVTNILSKNRIDLVDDCLSDDALILDIDMTEDLAESLEDDDFEILYDDSIFKDKGVHLSQNEELILHTNIHQSNEVLCSLIQQGNRQAAQDLCVKNKRLVDKYVIAYENRYGNHLDFEVIGVNENWEIILKNEYRYKEHTLSDIEEKLLSSISKILNNNYETYELLKDSDLLNSLIKLFFSSSNLF